jgi:predicted nucleic acid-binding protein
MPSKALVLDANILIRAVLGQRVRRILESHADIISFFIPETAYAEAEEHLAALVLKRGGEPDKALRLLRSLAALGNVMTRDIYADFETEARKRLASRDPDDWAIWTEDTDFFGCGVAMWTSASASIDSFLTQ